MIKSVIAAATAGLFAFGFAAMAQVPPDIAAKVRAAGQAMDPSIGQLYAPLFAKEPWADVTVARDIRYGRDPLQKLDIYTPVGKSKQRPVLLFVHGGGFVRGDKHGAFYPDNITAWGAQNGMIGVNIDYRLAPKDVWPTGARDIGSAIAWVHANIANYGGDPDRIIIWGHSAGANHVNDYIAHPELQGPEAEAVKGAVILSAFYAETPDPAKPNAYYGQDPAQTATVAIEGLKRSSIPLFVANAEFDPEQFKVYMTRMRSELCKTPTRCPRHVYVKNSNHFSEGMAVGTADQTLTGPLLEWVKGLR
ncbi:alpha/beta hydrolase [Sphingomonas sp. MMS24-J13]|uniref:alpha/beta hydrolase n=1 Tax=Sphingomonas sp. MMS24-J13 TaxID=3238686 RepID=UPI00384D324A